MIDKRKRFAAMFVLLGACGGETAALNSEVSEKAEEAEIATESPRVGRFDHLIPGAVAVPVASVAIRSIAAEKRGVETYREVTATFSADLRDDAIKAETQFLKAHGIVIGGTR